MEDDKINSKKSNKNKGSTERGNTQRRAGMLGINGNASIGLFIAANDKHAFCGVQLRTSAGKTVKRILGCEIVKISIGGIPYPGIFMLFDENKILVPRIIFPSEKRKIESLGYEVIVLNTRHTALANNILLSGKRAAISSKTDKETEEELKGLGYEVLRIRVDEFESIGSLAVISKSRAYASVAFSDDNISKLQSHLKARITAGTAGNRNLYISSSVIVNGKGMLIGDDTMPDEVMEITDAFS